MISNKTTYAYDALKRLTNVTFDSPTPETPGAAGVKNRSITLDKLDNILKITDNENAMVTEIFGELEGKGKVLNQYSRFNGLPLEYDRNGNLSAKGSRLFTYDYKNRLIRSSKGDDAVTFTYDVFGRQTSRTDLSGTCHYSYAGDQKIEERNASGQVTKHYFWGNGIDELLRLDVFNGSSSTPYYVHSDNIGSTTAITDGSGNVVERVRYDAYGIPTFTDALGQSLKKSTIGNTTLFQGREYDYDLALYNYRARYFDPSQGRFLQTDPLGYEDSMNLYQGMNMNPGNFVDPWGLLKIKYINKKFIKDNPGWVKLFEELWMKTPKVGNKELGSYLYSDDTGDSEKYWWRTGPKNAACYPKYPPSTTIILQHKQGVTLEGSVHTHPRGYAPESSAGDKEASKAKLFQNKPMYIVSEKGVREHLPGLAEKDNIIIDVDDFTQWIESNLFTNIISNKTMIIDNGNENE